MINIFYKYLLLVLIGLLKFSLLDAQTYRSQVFEVLQELDSLYREDSLLKYTQRVESRRIGEASSISNKYIFYRKLLETANSTELFIIIADSNLKPVIRGYSYMAYAYHMDSLNIEEQPTNFNFKLNALIGCRGYNQITFNTFKKIARKRGWNNPYPKPFGIDTEEIDAIQIENKIRKEQKIIERKTDY